MALIWKTLDAFKEKALLFSPDRTSRIRFKQKQKQKGITRRPSINRGLWLSHVS